MNRNDQLPSHLSGLCNEDRWRIIDAALDDIGPDETGRVSAQTWAAMSERDRALFKKKEPT